MYMAYRKRSLDLPVSEDSPASIKHPRSSTSTSSSSRPPLTVSTALEPAAPGDYTGGALPPIRSLTGLSLPSPAIPSFRHYHTGTGNSPSNVRPPEPDPSGLTAGLAQLSHTRAVPQHPQPAYPSYNPPPAHYTYAPPHPQPPPPLPPPPPQFYRSHTDQPSSIAAHHASSPMSSAHSDVSPHMPPVLRDMARMGEIHAPGGESAMAHVEMDGNMGSPPETVKVARNWSRDETLSLVRAIKRHYEALKRCKTNQERSNVWHRIHKEHSSQFPGRSKKASQDRWGKVLSDYKDVMVHNKEKGAARWTFDFFKEVAGIVEGDTQYMDSAISPSSSSATSGGRPLPAADDLSLYSFGGAPTAPPRSFAPGTAPVAGGPPNSSVPRPPMAQHRMSEPNLLHTVKHDLRHMPHRPPPPLTAHVRQSSAMHTAQQQQQRPPMQNQLSPDDVHPGFDNRPPAARYSPPRRTSYPQLLHQQQQLLSAQANAASRASRGSYHTFRYYPQLSAGTPNAMPASPIGESEGVNRHGDIPKQMRVHSWAPSTGSATPANPAPETAATINESPIIYPQSSHIEQGSQPVSPELQLAAPGDPEETCRHVLDMLGRQIRRIDVEQENLARLKESTQNSIHRVEQIMQMYIRQPPPPGSD